MPKEPDLIKEPGSKILIGDEYIPPVELLPTEEVGEPVDTPDKETLVDGIAKAAMNDSTEPKPPETATKKLPHPRSLATGFMLERIEKKREKREQAERRYKFISSIHGGEDALDRREARKLNKDRKELLKRVRNDYLQGILDASDYRSIKEAIKKTSALVDKEYEKYLRGDLKIEKFAKYVKYVDMPSFESKSQRKARKKYNKSKIAVVSSKLRYASNKPGLSRYIQPNLRISRIKLAGELAVEELIRHHDKEKANKEKNIINESDSEDTKKAKAKENKEIQKAKAIEARIEELFQEHGKDPEQSKQ